MTNAERRLLLPFLRDVAAVPHVVLAMTAEKLLKRFQPARKRRAPGQILREMADEAERLSKKDRRADVRAECVKRADGVCECGCGCLLGIGEWTAEWDEFYGRQHVTVEETWILARCHHRLKTENSPDRQAWDARFKAHCKRHRYGFRPRLTKELNSSRYGAGASK